MIEFTSAELMGELAVCFLEVVAIYGEDCGKGEERNKQLFILGDLRLTFGYYLISHNRGDSGNDNCNNHCNNQLQGTKTTRRHNR